MTRPRVLTMVDWADEITTRLITSPEFLDARGLPVKVGRVTLYRHLSGRERYSAVSHDGIVYRSDCQSEDEAIEVVLGFARELRHHLGDRWWTMSHEPLRRMERRFGPAE